MTPGFTFRMLGGWADGQRLGPFPAQPPELRVPYEVEHPLLPDNVHEWKVDRYFPSLFVPGIYCFFSTVEPSRVERLRIAAQTGQVFR